MRREAELGPVRRHVGIRDDHAARDPTEKAAAEIDDDREPIEELENDLAAEHDKGYGHQETEDDEQRLMCFVRLLRRAGDGDDVVEAHHEVGDDDRLDGAEKFVAAGDVFMTVVLGDK